MDMSAGPEIHVSPTERCDFAVAESGLNGDEQQSLVSSSDPGTGIRSRYQCCGLFVGQKFDRPACKTLRRKGQDTLTLQGHVRFMNGYELEERVQSGQAVISSPRTVATLVFEVIEEFEHECDIEILHAQLGRHPFEALCREPEQQAEGVPVGRDRMWTCTHLV